MEFNYLENIRKLTEKIAPFKRQLCNESRCPQIRKRWEDHQHKCHSQKLKKQPPESKETKPCIKIPKPETCDQLVQTSVDTKCNAETNCNIFQDDKQAIAKIASDVMNVENVGEFLVRNQSCNTTVSFKNFYKERLLYEVLQWLREVPIESEFNSTAKIVTEKTVNNLIDKIDKLSVEADEEWYEVKLQREIDQCLNTLPMSYHSTKCAKIRYILTESLITRIMVLNSKYLYQASNSFQDDLGVMNHYASSKEIFQIPIVSMFENEILSWLQSKNLKCEEGTSLNLKYITKMLLNRLLPFLMDKGAKRSKYLIKGGIVEVLNTLPLTMALCKNRIFLNGLAIELTNILLNAQNNFEQLTIYNNAYLGFIKTLTLNPNNNMNFLLEHDSVSKQLMLKTSNRSKVRTRGVRTNDSGESNNEKFQSNTSMNNLYKESRFVTMELNMSSFSQMDSTVTKDLNLSHTTLKILSVFKSKTSIVRRKNVKKTCIPSLLSISLASVDEKYYHSSCCSNFDKHQNTFRTINERHGSGYSKEETAYVEKVSAFIRVWIEKLSKSYNELTNQRVIEYITGKFAKEITHQVLFAPLVSEDNSEKEIYLGDIILRWLSSLSFVKTSNEAISYKNELLFKLRDLLSLSLLHEVIDPKMYLNYNVQDFMTENTDTLKGNSLSWINKKSLEVCAPPDLCKKLVHDFAAILYNELNNKRCTSNVTYTLRRWLQNIVESEETVCLPSLSKHFKNQIIHYSLVTNQNEKVSKIEGIVFENVMRQCLLSFFNEPDMNNRLVKDIFWIILRNILKNVYSHYCKTDNLELENENTPFETLKNELDHIIILSDWFKKLPKTSVLNRLRSRQRRMFLINLAKTIVDKRVNKGEQVNNIDEDFYEQTILNQCKQFGVLRSVCLDKHITKPLVDALVEYQMQNLHQKQNSSPHKRNKKRKEKEQEMKKEVHLYSKKKNEASDNETFKAFSMLIEKQIKNLFNYFFSTFNTVSTLRYGYLPHKFEYFNDFI